MALHLTLNKTACSPVAFSIRIVRSFRLDEGDTLEATVSLELSDEGEANSAASLADLPPPASGELALRFLCKGPVGD